MKVKEKQKFGKIMVEVEGVMIDIKNLPREKYEAFLDLINDIRIIYIAANHLITKR